MLIGSRQKLSTLTAAPVLNINGTPVLTRVSTSKSLGLLIDTNLTWSRHIEKLAKKMPLFCSYQTGEAIFFFISSAKP